MNPVSPTRVIGGRYVVLGELGRGGMGIVWRAEDRTMGRQVAVKELHLPQGLTPAERLQFRERLLREARNAGRLNDPGIVTVHDVISDDGVDHIVMELIDARTLTDVVVTDGPLDERSATAVAQQLLAALNTAHAAGVVHRDVKPSNVMLGSGGRVKLTDFGIAQAADDPRLTTTGSLIGSPGYMAPERLDSGAASAASDLWALGATLFYAVQGTGPFARDTTAATVAAVLHADVPPIRARGPIAAVVAGLLQRSPDARLSGVQAAALLASQPTMPMPMYGGGGEPETAPIPVAAPRRRRWVWPAVALVLGLVVGALGTFLLVRPTAPAVSVLTYGAGGDIPVFDITSKYCVPGQLAPGRSFPSSAYTNCDNPHDLEIFGILSPFDSQRELPYPALADLQVYSRAACTLLFDSALVEGADKATLQVVGLVPSKASFEGRSTPTSSFSGRDVLCLLRAADGSQLTDTRLSKDS
jgi:eukaryotic-like serine/threonine-protein kinase